MRDHKPTLPESPDAVQAEVARLLTTPELLDEDQGLALLCDSNQLRQLRNFRGFITKVMHNGIRKFIPKTMTMLSTLKIELEFYVAISPSYQRLRAQGTIPQEQHLRWYETALSEWVDKTGTEGGAFVRDILAHELVQHHTRLPHSNANDFAIKSAVNVEGELILRRYTHDVPQAFQDIANGELDSAPVALKSPMNLAYWLKCDGSQTITEVDDLTARALSLVDGRRTLSEIATCFSARGFPQVDSELLSGIFTRLALHTPLRVVR